MAGILIMGDTLPFKTISAGADIACLAADFIHATLKGAIEERGQATLMVSGGNSPLPVYDRLSRLDLEWNKVSISLVDDRWVDLESEGSNERAIREILLRHNVKRAKFISLKTKHQNPSEGLTELETRLQDVSVPFDLCVMGMGSDGHTASWFPKSEGLDRAMDSNNPLKLVAIDAKGCPGAGKFRHRISLTRSAIMQSRAIILYIPGAEKAEVFKKTEGKTVFQAPVTALRAAGERLTVFSGEA